MGSSLGVALRTDLPRWEVYYSRAGGWRLGSQLALDGVDATIADVRRMDPMVAPGDDPWPPFQWMEAGLVIDVPRQVVTWFEDGDWAYLPRIINYVIEDTWPGWTAVWSADGSPGILRACGVKPVAGAHRSHDTVPSGPSGDLLPWWEWHGVDPILVRLDDGRTVAWEARALIDDLASCGPDNIRKLALEVAGRAPTEQAEWDRIRDDEWQPDGGIVVDFPARTLRWWSLMEAHGHTDALDALWCGWDVRNLGDHYEQQAAILGQQIRSWPEDLAECRDELIRDLTASWRSSRSSNGHGLEELLRSHGPGGGRRADASLILSPQILQQIDPKCRRSAQDLATVLQGLLDRPLPPARTIDRSGRVTPPLPPVLAGQ